MNRRSALTALACALGISAIPIRGDASAPARLGVLAWGPEGCWIDTGGNALHRLTDRLTPGIDPVATSNGLWLVTASGSLHGWEPDTASSWRLRCAVEFAAPVHALTASPDGRWVLAAHGERLSLLDSRGELAKAFDGTDLQHERRGAATALFAQPRRRSLVAAWPALGEVWEISLDPAASPIFDGLVHDYRMSEGIAKPGYLGARRSPLGRPMPAFSFADARMPWLAGAQENEVVVVHLDVRRRIAALQVEAANPAGATLRLASREQGPIEWWLPAASQVHVIDTARWVLTAVHALPGPVLQLQAVDGAVWARVDERGAAELFVLRDGQPSEWRRVDGLTGPWRALHADPAGARLLVLRDDPPALLMLNAGGGVLKTWPLPAVTAAHGAAWFTVD